MEKNQCPDCAGDMEAGFIPDASYDKIVQTCWHRGEPEPKKFLGMKTKSGALDYDVSNMLGITTYRCTKCGLLKNYAPEKAS